MRFLIVAAMTAASMPVATASEKDVENAYFLCAVFDGTGLASSKCEISAWSSTVTTTIDMNSGEARKLCAQIAGSVRQKGRGFSDGWTLQIRSPYSGENSIAFCKL